MAGRIRTIKPELNEDAVVASLSDAAWRLYVSMFTLADDYGALRAEPALLMGQVFWGRPRTMEDMLALLRELEEADLVKFYRVRSQTYAQVLGWFQHQRVNHPGTPRVPRLVQPESEEIRLGRTNFKRTSRESLSLTTTTTTNTNMSDRVPAPLQLTAPEPPAAPAERVSFQQLEAAYQLYPRKEGKGRGMARLKATIKTPERLEAFTQAVKIYARKVARDGTEPRFVKLFCTFVNCWEDYLDPQVLASGSSLPIQPSLPRVQQALPPAPPPEERASQEDIQALVAKVTGRVTGQA